MGATELLDKNIRPVCQSMHTARWRALSAGVEAALRGECVTVTALGRAVGGGAMEKHRIKRMDELVGNAKLWAERAMVYEAMAGWLLGTVERPWLVVDWSVLSPDGQWHLLRASVPVGGRALSVYEEVHPQAHYADPTVHERFLAKLAEVLPGGCRPIVLSDAGFKNPWFRAVKARGWDWIGRVRGNVQLTRPGEQTYLDCRLLGHVLEEAQPTYLGVFELAKEQPLVCTVYGLRKPPKGRVHKTRRGERALSSASRASARREREPWLLATSLPGGADLTDFVLNGYRKRMQVEEGFRDTKSEYYGLGVERSGSRSAERLQALLLIAALALFSAYLLGKAAQARGLERHYQANTTRTRQILSFVFLGLRVLQRAIHCLDLTDEELLLIRGELRLAAAAFLGR